MGSRGSGRFSDYPGTSRAGSNGGDGSSDGDDRCARAFSVNLQDVEHGEYFERTSTVPAIGTEIGIELRKRLVAVDKLGRSIGNLPTTYNYLADCLADGFVYEGVVSASATGPSAVVTVDCAPAS